MIDRSDLPFSVGLLVPEDSILDLGVAQRPNTIFGVEVFRRASPLPPSRTRLFDFIVDRPGTVTEILAPYRLRNELHSECPVWLGSGTRTAEEVKEAGLAFVPEGRYRGVVHALLDMLDYGGVMTGIAIDDISALIRRRQLHSCELVGATAPELIAQLDAITYPTKGMDLVECLLVCRARMRTANELSDAVEARWPEAALELQVRDPAAGESWGATLLFASSPLGAGC